MDNQITLTVTETAGSLRVHRNTVRKWLHNGTLQGQKAGKKWIVTQTAIDAFIEASKPVKAD